MSSSKREDVNAEVTYFQFLFLKFQTVSLNENCFFGDF